MGLDKLKWRKELKEGTVFKVIEKVIIKIPIHLKRNAAHKPYLGSLRVVKQGPTSVTVALDGTYVCDRSVRYGSSDY